jgi:hypothetical protein
MGINGHRVVFTHSIEAEQRGAQAVQGDALAGLARNSPMAAAMAGAADPAQQRSNQIEKLS